MTATTPWSKSNKSDTYAAEVSDFREAKQIDCPDCGRSIQFWHVTSYDFTPDNEEIAGTRYRCPCGQRFLLIND